MLEMSMCTSTIKHQSIKLATTFSDASRRGDVTNQVQIGSKFPSQPYGRKLLSGNLHVCQVARSDAFSSLCMRVVRKSAVGPPVMGQMVR